MRLFLAIQLQDYFADTLLDLQDRWRAIGVRGHFTPAEKLHLTLAFIGEYGNPDDVMDALSQISFRPFTMRLDGAGNFHDTYWAGIEPSKDLLQCAQRIRHVLAENNIPYDRRKFAPHITLVRKGECLTGMTRMLENLPSAAMEVREFSLLRSDRGKNGMIYTPIGSILAD